MLQLGLLLRTVLDEVLDLLDLGRHLHHPQVTDLLGRLDRAPLQVLPQPDDDRVETHGEEQFPLQVVVDLHDDEAVLLGHALLEGQRADVVLDLSLVERLHLGQVDLRVRVLQLRNAALQAGFLVVGLEQFLAPGDVDKGLAVDDAALLLGQLHLHKTNVAALLLALRDVLQHRSPSVLALFLPQHHS